MSHVVSKPKLTAEELVEKLRVEKGIMFNITSAEEAVEYLRYRNNYLRIASYRKNYPKHRDGMNVGKYIQLEFAYLKELSIIDMYLRRILLNMCIDLEHALKVRLLAFVEQDANEDGYEVVQEFLNLNPQVKSSIARKADAIFTGDLIKSYFRLKNTYNGSQYPTCEIEEIDCPLWVLLEIITFGEFNKLCYFYERRHPERAPLIEKRIINPISSLRNACAHNNCLLANFSYKDKTTQPSSIISKEVARIVSIGERERRNKLSSRPLFEIACLIYYYSIYVPETIKKKTFEQLQDFTNNRMQRNMSYFDNNRKIKSSLQFLKKLVDNYA